MHRVITFGKCFADPIAIRIMRLLLKSDLTIVELQDTMDLDRHTVDLRLTKLREAKIITHRQEGRWLSYAIHVEARPVVETLLTTFYKDVSWDPNCVNDDLRSAKNKGQTRGHF